MLDAYRKVLEVSFAAQEKLHEGFLLPEPLTVVVTQENLYRAIAKNSCNECQRELRNGVAKTFGEVSLFDARAVSFCKKCFPEERSLIWNLGWLFPIISVRGFQRTQEKIAEERTIALFHRVYDQVLLLSSFKDNLDLSFLTYEQRQCVQSTLEYLLSEFAKISASYTVELPSNSSTKSYVGYNLTDWYSNSYKLPGVALLARKDKSMNIRKYEALLFGTLSAFPRREAGDIWVVEVPSDLLKYFLLSRPLSITRLPTKEELEIARALSEDGIKRADAVETAMML